MLEQFSRGSIQVLLAAHDELKQEGGHTLDISHLLVGLFKGAAGFDRVLLSCACEPDVLWQHLKSMQIGSSQMKQSLHSIAFTQKLHETFSESTKLAQRYGTDEVTPETLALAAVSIESKLVENLLEEFGVSVARLQVALEYNLLNLQVARRISVSEKCSSLQSNINAWAGRAEMAYQRGEQELASRALESMLRYQLELERLLN